LSLQNLYKAIEKIESGGDPDALSSKGAKGLMQVMPSTARNPGYGITPARNQSKAEYVRVGKDYAKAMYNKFGGNINAVLAAYNMGPGATEKWIAGGGDKSKLPRETRNYIPKVKRELNRLNQGSFKMSKKKRIKKVGSVLSDASERLRKIKEKKLKAKTNIAKQLEEAKKKKAALEAKTAKKIARQLKTKSRVNIKTKTSPLTDKKLNVKDGSKVKTNQTKTNNKTNNKTNQTKTNNKTNNKTNQTKTNQTKTNNKTNQTKKIDNKTMTGIKKRPFGTKQKELLKNPKVWGTGIALATGKAAYDQLKNKKEKETVLSKKRDKDNRLPPGAFGGRVKPTTAKPPKPPKLTKPTKPNVNLQGGQGGYGTSGGISPLLQKHVDSRGGWKAYGPKSIGSQIGKLLGEDPKASKMVDKAETTLYNSLLEKKNSDDPNVTLTSAEKAHMKKVESRKKGGMIKRNSGGKVKRNMGGKVTPRKKTVFRRGGGKALRGFGRATYSNKLY